MAAQRIQYKTIVYIICLTAALGGLLFGLDQGFIANALDSLKGHYQLDVHQGEKYSAILALGGIWGALLSGIFARALGRKNSLIFAGAIFTGASIFSAFLPPLPTLSACRFALGFAVGVSSFIVPLYLSETAPASIRGSMGTLFQLMITIGIFLISVINVYIAKTILNPGRALSYMFLTVAFFATMMFIGAFFLPPSPRWLMLRGLKAEATKVLNRTLNTPEEVETELQEITETLEREKNASSRKTMGPYFFKVLLLGVILQMFQQLVGINAMIYYAPTIFGYAGMKSVVAKLAVPTVNMLFTFPAIALVDRWGRKNLLYLGAILMLITNVAAGIAFHGLDTATGEAEVMKYLLLSSVVVYIFGFAVSWGPVVWLVCSEIFPLAGREIGMTATTMVNWTFAGLVMNYSLSFMKRFGNPALFFTFAFFCALALLFVYFFVPETKGTSLEQIEKNLKAGKPLRTIGYHA